MITPASHQWLRLHRHYRKQLLPFAGGVMNQPNKYVEAMDLLESTFGDIEREHMEQARKEARLK